MPRLAHPISHFLPHLCCIALLGLTACGYRPLMVGGTATSDSGATSISSSSDGTTRLVVHALDNDSPEPWLDRVVTDALRREVEARGALALVNDPSGADLVLRGRVRPLLIQGRSFSSFVAALEYSITMVLDLEVVRAGGDVVRFDPAMLSETDIYLASADIEATRTHKLEALRRMSDVLASRVADSIELMERPIDSAEEGT